jgi:hypothetical protein
VIKQYLDLIPDSDSSAVGGPTDELDKMTSELERVEEKILNDQ